MFFKKKSDQCPDHEFIQMDEGVSAEAAQVSEKVQVGDGSNDNNDGAGIVYPSGLTLVLLVMSCFIAMFLVALVRTEETV